MLQNILEKWQKENAGSGSGLAICIQDNAGAYTFYSYGICPASSDQPLPLNPLLPIASISKLFTAVAIHQLMQEGRKHPLTQNPLDLEDKIVDLLPQLKIDWMENVTLEDALAHRTGMGRQSNEFGLSPDELRAKGLTDVVPERIDYSNRMYAWLGILIADMSGMPFHEYVTKEIIQRHKLGEIYPSLPLIPDHLKKEIPASSLTNNFISAADSTGGFYARPQALAHFISKLARGEILAGHIATTDAVKGMFAPTCGHGLGAHTANFKTPPYETADIASNPIGDLFGHTGGMDGMMGDVRYNPQTNASIAVFHIGHSNTIPAAPAAIVTKIISNLLLTSTPEPTRESRLEVREDKKATM